jgi:hypothetical protein
VPGQFGRRESFASAERDCALAELADHVVRGDDLRGDGGKYMNVPEPPTARSSGKCSRPTRQTLKRSPLRLSLIHLERRHLKLGDHVTELGTADTEDLGALALGLVPFTSSLP